MKGKFRITKEWNYIFWESTIPSLQIAGYTDFSLTTCTVLFGLGVKPGGENGSS